MKVRDNTGKIIYHTVETDDGLKVYNGNNKLLGYYANGVTRKPNGQVISYSESPGLLVGVSI